MKRTVKYPLKDARIICSTNKEALSYKKGEEMVFTFKFESSDTPAEGLFFEYKHKNKVYYNISVKSKIYTRKTNANSSKISVNRHFAKQSEYKH